jgi:hypothetical protein
MPFLKSSTSCSYASKIVFASRTNLGKLKFKAHAEFASSHAEDTIEESEVKSVGFISSVSTSFKGTPLYSIVRRHC